MDEDFSDVLILFPRILWNTKMSFVRRVVCEKMISRGAKLTGQGWDNYDTFAPLHKNLEKFPNARCIFWYKPLGGNGIPRILMPRIRDIPAVVSYNEANWPDHRAACECMDTGTDLVIAHHANDILRFHCKDNHPYVKNIPHCADPDMFIPKPWQERSIDFLLTGVISEEIYPLRSRFKRLMEEGKFPGRVEILPHPGYRLGSLEKCRQQAQRYADKLCDAKVAVMCSSKYKYLLAKYIEAMAAGCVILADMPHDVQFVKKTDNCVVFVPDDATDEDLVWYATQAWTKSKSPVLAREAFEEHYTVDSYLKSFRAAITECLYNVHG